ncbi:O-methyltransferase family 2 protein [Tieghemostelium lacteum]|uniref:O-methyltransferase family 2 protein n=1 Tax=Tieghemostelium lacteum TaxID=361077 RepID=A0A151Z2R3_TIELA|nr:O-methyltransferase family 2 protein [Tieghemostelium lacteum]|eukprot:KYQ88217.1 O-methyltransferase family 2 protein [Tieghemostelium lacteum]
MSEAEAFEKIHQISMGHMISRIVHAGTFLRIPDYVENGPKKAEDVAKDLNANVDNIYRLMRAMSSQGIMKEEDDHVFSKTPMSTLLTSGPQGYARSIILAECSDVHYRGFLSLVKTIQTGIFHGPSDNGVENFWDIHRNHPDVDLEFSKNMTALSLRQSPIVVKESDFTGCEITCDLGGSQGIITREILKQNPHVKKGINFDMGHLIELNKKQIREGSEMDRFEDQSGDFFTAVPYADAYTMKFIFHDWNDELCRKILSNIEKANPKAIVYIYDSIIDTKNQPGLFPLLDIKMMHFLDGRERSVEDWNTLVSGSNYRIASMNSTIQPGIVKLVHK